METKLDTKLVAKLKAENCTWTFNGKLLYVELGVRSDLKRPSRRNAEKIGLLIKSYYPSASYITGEGKILGVTLVCDLDK